MSIKFFRRFDLVLLGYALTGFVLSLTLGIRFDAAYFFDYRVDLQYLTVVLLCFYTFLIYSAISSRLCAEDSVLCGPKWRARIRRDYLNLQQAVDFVRAMLILKLLLITYGCIKQAIPLMHAKNFDDELLAIDVAMHGGVNLMRWLVENFPWLESFMDISYFSWYYTKAIFVAVFVFVSNRALHHWYFRSFCLVWMLGGACAVLVPSLGPIYIHPEWFSHLDMPIARGLQTQLMLHYQAVVRDPGFPSVFAYEGIAAFPSLHVAIVALNMFFAFQLSRLIAALCFVYLVIIQCGSVYLGWHYAIDGYFGVILAYVLFRVSKRG